LKCYPDSDSMNPDPQHWLAVSLCYFKGIYSISPSLIPIGNNRAVKKLRQNYSEMERSLVLPIGSLCFKEGPVFHSFYLHPL
jgi:hypothetical protein